MVNMRTTQQIKTPDKIIEFLGRENRIYPVRNTKGYSVSALLGCPRKAFFQKTRTSFEKIDLTQVENNVWRTTRGNFLHQITQAYSWNELEGKYIVSVNGEDIPVFGRLDCYDPEEKNIIEFKTMQNVSKSASEGLLPFDSHIKQLQIYGTIFEDIIPVEKLTIVYLDMNDVVSFEIQKEDMSNWIINKVTSIENAIKSKEMPDGQVNSFCKLCNYQTTCSNNENGIEKPLSVLEAKRR